MARELGQVAVTRGHEEPSGEQALLAEGGPGVWVEGGRCPAGRGQERLVSVCVSARERARDAGARVRARGCVCMSEGVTEAPTCPARPSCGRRQAAGEGEAPWVLVILGVGAGGKVTWGRRGVWQPFKS